MLSDKDIKLLYTLGFKRVASDVDNYLTYNLPVKRGIEMSIKESKTYNSLKLYNWSATPPSQTSYKFSRKRLMKLIDDNY